MGLGKNVGALVAARKVSYGDVARGIDEDVQAVWSLVKRKSKKSAIAQKLADYFEVPLERLLAEDFDPAEVSKQARSQQLELRAEEAEAVKRLRGALPGWRGYVLRLAMIDNQQQQELLLHTMQDAATDQRVEQFVSVAPHAAARREPVYSTRKEKSRIPDVKARKRTPG